MPDISLRDHNCIINILDSVQKIKQYSGKFSNADEFFNNTLSFDASMMNFVVIGEMVEKLSEELISRTEGKINWSKVKSFRNIIAHNYFGVDAEEVWQIIQTSLLQLEENLEEIIR